LEVVTGGMFCGKSEELVRRLRRAMIARQNVQVFKPATDTRFAPEMLVTRDKRQLEAQSVPNSSALLALLADDVDVVGIDEAQFFDDGLVAVIDRLADEGRRVIVAGLDLDYLRRPFGPMAKIMAIAEYVEKLHAVCVRCGEPAQYSQRISGGEEQVLVGDTDAYEARCRRCYQPGVAAVGQESKLVAVERA
jgi:thymidine kinase